MDDDFLFYGFGTVHDLSNDERNLPLWNLRSVSRAACVAYGKKRDQERRSKHPMGFNTRPK